MTAFPRTDVGGLSLSRMIIGTNWFMGFSHCTDSKDKLIKSYTCNRKSIADILEVFFAAGINTVMGMLGDDPVQEALKDVEDRTGIGAIRISTPSFPISAETPEKGFDIGECERIIDDCARRNAAFVMPHQQTTDAMVDRCTRKIRHVDQICKLIRERNMLPGLSTHMPESIIFADESGLDVESYVSMFNSMGFLMQVEVDWVASIIRSAKKPVMTIKPMAAGQIRPFQAFNFVWSAIRDQDMVAVGTMTPDEAREVIEISMSVLEHRSSQTKLQETRSKASLKTQG